MDLRCLVFCSDIESAEPICHVLADLGAEAERCSEAVAAVERVANETFQLVIADWDRQKEAELVLNAARGRKPAERPLTLAVVSDDAGVAKALQAGANSILRKPILVNQVTDTLQTARSLLKARWEASSGTAASASGAAIPTFPVEPATDAHLRAGEFLQSTGPAPATQIDTESEMQKSLDRTAAAEIDPLKDLEPMAAAVTQEPVPPPPPSPAPNEPRGLQWYLNQRAAKAPAVAAPAALSPAPPNAVNLELLGYDQTPSVVPQQLAISEQRAEMPPPMSEQRQANEEKQEAELFAYIDGEGKPPEEEGRRSFRLGKGSILFAASLAAIAIVAAPQAPWHVKVLGLWSHGRQAVHSWLNPQPVAPTQAPSAHEDFGRPGDEYRLPVAEAIPDATTDPSQIRVVPVVDPTAKKPTGAPNTDPNAVPPDGTVPNPGDPAQPQGVSNPGTPVQDNPSPGNAPAVSTPQGQPSLTPPDAAPNKTTTVTVSPVATAPVTGSSPPHSDLMAASIAASTPQPARNPQPRPISTSNPPIPSSLKSQMVSMTPEASGNRAPETALPSIEPVDVPEVTERGLLAAQPGIAYPANAKGQQGTVILQVLVGRDGSVQDAKFLQGSLAFARTAIDGVKQWTFKPYLMNGRPVSVQTKLTLTFKPGQ